MAMLISKFHKLVQSKKVWGAFAVLISVAFVFAFSGGTGSSSQKASREQAKRAKVAGILFGEEVSTDEYYAASRATRIMGMITGRNPSTNEELNSLTWMRLAVLKKAADMGIAATTEQMDREISNMPDFQNPQTGTFSQEIYEYVLNQLQLTSKQFQDMILDSLTIDQTIRRVASEGALVTDTEVEDTYHLYYDVLTVQYADLPRSLAEMPEVTLEDAGTYYTNNIEQFINPETVKVHYIEFPVADYTNDVVFTEAQLQGAYEQVKQQRYIIPPSEDAPATAELQYQPFEEVEDELAAEMAMYEGRIKARNEAQRVVSKLARADASFEAIAEEAGKQIVTTTPRFSESEQPRGIDETAPFARQAFGLEVTPTRYYSNPVVGENSVYVIALKERFDAFLPAFDVVQDKALEQAQIISDEQAYIDKAESIYEDIKTALENESTFEQAAADAELQVETMEPFSANTAPEDMEGRQIAVATALLEKGSLANLIPTADTYLLAYVADKVPAELPLLTSSEMQMLRLQMRSGKANRIAAAWQFSVMDEAELEDRMAQPIDEE